ncbi:hypothetical protein N136_00412 [Leifsonia aquatica ATCC 14665]|uniref:Uncharacterized protein n=1 Tax=Leifsonia aquatica ATCC 14665 TaxID=1358026 RepID=U2RD85_LEIAQ|nr:hypothetical protein N136_00412 [Leifsonia aquatica ATCC 14665]
MGRAPGFILAAASAAATAIAAPADAFWHSTFGRDAVLRSPPHLLSVISTTVLLGAMLVSVSDRPWRQLQIGLFAVVLAAAQILVMEYDTDVPQFSETLYLPVALLSLLSAGWVIIRTTRFSFAHSGDRRLHPVARGADHRANRGGLVGAVSAACAFRAGDR